MVTLYHFTCRHSAERIDADGEIRPMIEWADLDHALLRRGMPRTGLAHAPAVWWATYDPNATRAALGLTSTIISCDRTERRYEFTIDADDAMPWLVFAAQYHANRDWTNVLRVGADPTTWVVGTEPVSVSPW